MTTEAISHLDGPEFEGIFEPGDEPRPVGSRPRRKRPSVAASTARPVFDMNGHGPQCSWCRAITNSGTSPRPTPAPPKRVVDIALVHDLYEATPDTTPCPDCEWTDAQDLWEPEAHRVLAHPCPKHTHTEEDQ